MSDLIEPVKRGLEDVVGGRQTKRRVLVTDDDANTLRVTKNIIEDFGYEVVALERKGEALKRLREIKPDLVTTDLMSPGLGGFDFIRAIKELDPTIPVIVISGNINPSCDVDAENARKALQLGAFDCLQKPFDVTELRQVVERALKTRRSKAES